MTIFDLAKDFKARLLAGEAQAAARMTAAYLEMYERQRDQLEFALAQIDSPLKAEAEFAAGRLGNVIKQLSDELEKYAAFAAGEISERQVALAQLAQEHSAGLVMQQLGDPPKGFDTYTWQKLPTETLEQLAGFTETGTPLDEMLQKLVPHGIEKVKQAILVGTARGMHPDDIASLVQDELGGNLGRFLTVQRTAEMQAYREGQRLALEENAEVIKGWRWFASLSFDTCLACLAKHGTFHPLGTRMESHWNCRCVEVPETKSWEELGFPGIEEIEQPWETGEEWLKRQDPENQRRTLGSARYEAWKADAVKLGDFLGHEHDPVWGGMVTELTLTDVLGSEADTFRQRVTAAVKKILPAQASTPHGPGPISDSLQMRATGKLRGEVSDALATIDSIHTVDPLPVIPLQGSATKTRHGAFAYNSQNGKPIRVEVTQNGPWPRLTTAHEIGHFIDHQGLGTQAGRYASLHDAELDEWRKAVDASEPIRKLNSRLGKKTVLRKTPSGTLVTMPIDSQHVEYLLRRQEIFARSYAQYIATRGNNVKIKTDLETVLQKDRYSLYPRHWDHKDFEKIAEAFDNLFRKRGWLK